MVNQMNLPNNNKINICHIASGDLWAGAEIQVYNIIHGLIKLGKFNISAIIMNKGKLYHELRKIRINVFLVDEKKYTCIKQILMIRKIISENKIQIIHSHRYKENISASLIKVIFFFSKIFLIKTQHASFNVPSTNRMQIYRAIDLFCTMYIFDKIIVVSDDIANQFKKFVPETNIITIHNSICFERYIISPDIKINHHSHINIINIATIGRLVKIKDIDKFINIIIDLVNSGLKIKAYIVGDGPERKHLTNLVEKYRATKYIIFLGNVDNISETYNKIDILFITSIHEGVPTVLLEAMYFGKIVIAHNVGGIPEIIKNSNNGFLFNNVEQAKNIAKMIYTNPAKYNYIRVNARKTIESKYNNLIQEKKYSMLYYKYRH